MRLHGSDPLIESLHSKYCSLTGFTISLDFAREAQWFEWHKRGLTIKDLSDLIPWLRKQIKERKRRDGCLKFSNLVGNLDFTEEDLAMMRAESRAHVDPAKASVLAATGREMPTKPARSIGDVLAGEIAFKEFQKLKEIL